MEAKRNLVALFFLVGCVYVCVAAEGMGTVSKDSDTAGNKVIAGGMRQRLRCYQCDEDLPNCHTVVNCHTACYETSELTRANNETRVLKKGCWGEGKKIEKKCEASSVESSGKVTSTKCCGHSSCNGMQTGNQNSWSNWGGTNWGSWNGGSWSNWGGSNWGSWNGGSGGGSYINCYDCDSLGSTGNCPEKDWKETDHGASIRTASCDGSCYKQVGEIAGIITVSRGCDWSSCTEKDYNEKILGIRVRDRRTCCKTEKCNSASGLGGSVTLAVALVALVGVMRSL